MYSLESNNKTNIYVACYEQSMSNSYKIYYFPSECKLKSNTAHLSVLMEIHK